ncbi:SYG1 ERD2 like integral membrane required for retention of ER lumen [Cryptosporidium sp. chipmunk genotype I]|uniref:SYG1 ERD2 like integral membrane required for retention of ER lumen n=1 Tax=Cryptosporidium sp. chipmunk genotype I TaxID=1280935 RepID=UPI00351A2158|nr:SYG1 ERD2 like integral membrane required for retention of ER lumen [Cryptosporidium sp. chipmunk genotype I]
MKFVDRLESFESTKWRGKFVDYRALTRSLNLCHSDFLNSIGKKSNSIALKEQANHIDVPYKPLNKDVSGHFVLKLEQFHLLLKQNIEVVTSNYNRVLQDNSDHLDCISTLLDDKSAQISSKIHLPNLILDIWKTFDDLQEYFLINKLAVMKLLMRRDELFEFYLDNLPSSDSFISGFDKLRNGLVSREKLIKLFSSSKDLIENSPNYDSTRYNSNKDQSSTKIVFNKMETQEFDSIYKSSVFELEALMEYGLKSGKMIGKPFFSPDFKMSFLIGICVVLLFNLFVICRLPVINSEYSIQGTLAIFPLFRLVLMGIFVLWGSGISIGIMEYYGVNYKYMIGMDPNSRVNTTTIFSFAALQTIVWIIIFTLFITDYRLGVSLFSYFNIEYYPLWIYPALLMAIEFLLLFIPSRTFTYEYRKAIFYSILEVFSHGIIPKVVNVTLRANIVGDIFTTLSKPFGDVEYTFTFFVFVIKNRGDVLPTSLFNFLSNYRWMQTIALALPYEIRFFQCGMRYLTDESPSRRNHLYNMGKYTTGLAIAIVATVPWTAVTSMSPFTARLLWFSCYITGTVYMFIWDIYMDWGLMQEKSSFLRSKSIYPSWYYFLVAFYNLIGRLTWAITLIPITIIDDIQINAALINLLVATIEVFRRTLWCTIRLEWEQVHLNSKQPANLWVGSNKNKLSY